MNAAEMALQNVVDTTESDHTESNIELKKTDKFVLPRGFKLKKGGIYYADPDEEEPKDIWVCSHLDVTAKTKDDVNGNWGKVLEFNDPDNYKHKLSIPMDLFSSDGAEARRLLLNQGLQISTSSKSRNLLSQYIQQAKTVKTIRCVNKTGWYKDSFVLPNRVIGKRNTDVILQNSTGDHSSFRKSGILDEWKIHVSKYCINNPRLMFAVSVAFAPPLIDLLNLENGGFHFRGGSSIGKTTNLFIANSVWANADGLKRWRTTSNGLEGTSEAHNDILLSLDEIGELNSREAGNVSYMLANGQGKGRSDRNGNVRISKTWRLFFLSTGEVSLSQHVSDGGGKVRAGHEIRVLDIPAYAGAGFGIFNDLHHFSCGSQFSNTLTNNAKTYYGTASLAYLEKLVLEREQVTIDIEQLRKGFLENLNLINVDGQVKRAAGRFAIVAAAGELATSWNITGWMPGQATQAAITCFKDWLLNRGGTEPQEEAAALRQVRSFIEAHGESRFARWGDKGSKTINRVGIYRLIDDELTYYILPESFRSEICKGLDYKLVLSVLKNRGFLIHQSDKNSKNERLPGIGQKRVYVIRGSILDE